MNDQPATTTMLQAAACALMLSILVLGCRTPADEPDECPVAQLPADKSTKAPRPDVKTATFHFHGNNPEQREFVIVHEDGSYDYVERWNFGVPKKGTLRSLDPRNPKASWEDDLPIIGKDKNGDQLKFEGLQDDVPAKLKLDWDDELQGTFGWDWKVGCRMHVCRHGGNVCCHQRCTDGGAEGTAYEPPDGFACMNPSAGGHYAWFIDGLRDGGMTELVACD